MFFQRSRTAVDELRFLYSISIVQCLKQCNIRRRFGTIVAVQLLQYKISIRLSLGSLAKGAGKRRSEKRLNIVWTTGVRYPTAKGMIKILIHNAVRSRHALDNYKQSVCTIFNPWKNTSHKITRMLCLVDKNYFSTGKILFT